MDLFSIKWDQLPKQILLTNSFKLGRNVSGLKGGSVWLESSKEQLSPEIRKVSNFGHNEDRSCKLNSQPFSKSRLINSPPKTFKIDVT